MARLDPAAAGCGGGTEAARSGWGAAGCCGWAAGAGAGRETTGASNSGTVCRGRRRHHSSPNSAAKIPAAAAIHGQYPPGADVAVLSTTCGRAKLSVAAVVGCGSGAATWGVGDGWLCGTRAAPGAAAVEGTGAVRLADGEAFPRAGCTAGVADLVAVATGRGALEAAGVAGAGAGVGAGLGAAERTTGFSSSTGPAARGLPVGRAVGKVKTGVFCAAAGTGTSGSNSAAAPAILAMPPETVIILSIVARLGR